MLKKRALGNSGIEVNPMGIGLWAMGGKTWGPTDDEESLSTIDRALDLGIDFFDTADVYGDGHSEELLGRAMKGRRDRFVVGTKIGWIHFDGDKGHSAYTSADKVVKGVESNLKRLKTDYIDVIQWHVDFQESTMVYFIEGAHLLKKQGKIRAFGLSTSNLSYVQAFSVDSKADTLQIDYSILNRTAEKEIFPYCRQRQLGTIIRGGLAMGLLTGKFSRATSFPMNDFRNSWLNDPAQNKQYIQDLEVVQKLRGAFPEKNLAQLALRFILSCPDVSVVIPGAKRIAQLEDNVQSGEIGLLSAEEMKLIDDIVAPGGGRKIWPA